MGSLLILAIIGGIFLPLGGILLSPLCIFDKEAKPDEKVFGFCVLILELTFAGVYFSADNIEKNSDNPQSAQVSKVKVVDDKNVNTVDGKVLIGTKIKPKLKNDTDEKNANENKRTKKNAEEDKSKMEEMSMKKKMDMLIPISLKYKWKEADVRQAVQLMERCGVQFSMLSTNPPEYDSSLNQFMFRIQNSLYDSAPVLSVRVKDNHISMIIVDITSNSAVNYFIDKSHHRVEPFKHTYKKGFALYINEGERELFNSTGFDKIIFNQERLDKMKVQLKDYVKSKGGNDIDKFKFGVSVQFDIDTYNNPVPIPAEELIDGKVLFLWQIDYSVKSEVYGKDKDKYHAEILIDDDNMREISLREL